MEYANTVWDPVENQTLTQKIEMVQRKSIRWICRNWKSDVSPDDMRKSLKLETLETRRSKSKLEMLFDIISGNKFVDNSIHPVRQRCINEKYQPIQGRIKCYANSFFPSTIKTWNKLPTKIANLKTEKEFKNSIDNLLL